MYPVSVALVVQHLIIIVKHSPYQSLKDEKDELLQKMDAYKGELEKSKKKMRKYKKLAESKGSQGTIIFHCLKFASSLLK